MVVQSIWCANLVSGPLTSRPGLDVQKIENVLAIDVPNQRLKVLTDRNTIFDMKCMVIVLAILRLLLTVGEYEHPTKQVKLCRQNRLVKAIENV